LLEDGKVGVGVFPEGEELLVGGAGRRVGMDARGVGPLPMKIVSQVANRPDS